MSSTAASRWCRGREKVSARWQVGAVRSPDGHRTGSPRYSSDTRERSPGRHRLDRVWGLPARARRARRDIAALLPGNPPTGADPRLYLRLAVVRRSSRLNRWARVGDHLSDAVVHAARAARAAPAGTVGADQHPAAGNQPTRCNPGPVRRDHRSPDRAAHPGVARVAGPSAGLDGVASPIATAMPTLRRPARRRAVIRLLPHHRYVCTRHRYWMSAVTVDVDDFQGFRRRACRRLTTRLVLVCVVTVQTNGHGWRRPQLRRRPRTLWRAIGSAWWRHGGRRHRE